MFVANNGVISRVMSFDVHNFSDNGQRVTCICDSSQGNMREPDMNGRKKAGARVGVLFSSLGSLEGTETVLALLTLPRSSVSSP